MKLAALMARLMFQNNTFSLLHVSTFVHGL